jgi:hypothetical protein
MLFITPILGSLIRLLVVEFYYTWTTWCLGGPDVNFKNVLDEHFYTCLIYLSSDFIASVIFELKQYQIV